MGASARRDSWSGVPWSHLHFVLEFSLISVVSICWGNERKKEKIQRKRWDLRENEGKKEKKCCETEREETIPLKTKTCLPYCGVAVERKTSHMLSSCGYVVNKEPHNKIFFFFRKVAHYTVNNFLTMDPWLLATNNYLSLMIK